jgi:hypothetical protein
VSLFRRHKPEVPALHVRLQHELLDNAAIEGLWVGSYDGYLHLRAAKTIIEGVKKPIPHGELLVPSGRIVFLEVLGGDGNPAAEAVRLPGDRDS